MTQRTRYQLMSVTANWLVINNLNTFTLKEITEAEGKATKDCKVNRRSLARFFKV